MEWYLWVILGISVVTLILDWFIVMGGNPRKWKGGGKNVK